MDKLFEQQLKVINVGLATFADNINHAQGKAVQLNWQPPSQGDIEVGKSLASLVNEPEIELANQKAMQLFLAANPTLVDVQLAGEAFPEMKTQKLILHSGPPIAYSKMCGPMQGAIIGAIIYEGWAKTKAEAEQQIELGLITSAPCHNYQAVGPMAGIISPSMPLWVVENKADPQRKRAYSNFNEGLGKVLRFGAFDKEVLLRLQWMSTALYLAMKTAVSRLGGLEIKPLIAQALHMGDEVHNRNRAATGLFLKKILPHLLDNSMALPMVKRVVEFIAKNDHFFLNLSMASAKCMLDAATNIKGSTLVTAMSRNGVNFGIRLSGTGDRWFQAPAKPVNGLFFTGYSAEDAAPDLGDSAITETAGLGAFAMAASPAIVKFVSGNSNDALNNSRKMHQITCGSNPAFTLPALNFLPSAAGIDARKVIDRSILPVINTGIAHKNAGVGQIGAGITTAPLACFSKAITAFYKKYK